ncbi:MAG: 23S rRNA (adenine(2030)-N(6))-methyltransferase RlmJ, partial [Planctomycetota bacterium]
VFSFTSEAIASHFDFVRLASMISENASGCCAHLWVTTRPTPPAPMIRTFFAILKPPCRNGVSVCLPLHRATGKLALAEAEDFWRDSAMLSYQHAYHAGNFADVHKHVALCLLLEALRRKEKPFFVLDAYAGRGLYDLNSPESAKTGEYTGGIGRLADAADARPALAPYLAALKACEARHPGHYPGSPWLILHGLRPQDRMACCELHPAEFDALRAHVGGLRRVALHRRDGLEAMRALLPPKERRGLLLIDPSYEVKREYGQVAKAVIACHRHWREGMLAIWYPLLPAGHHAALLDALRASGVRKILDSRLIVGTPGGERGMHGSGMLVVNPPWGFSGELGEALRYLAGRLGRDKSAQGIVKWLVTE